MKPNYYLLNLMFVTRPESTDINIINEVIANDTYKIASTLKTGDFVIDIGAHIGSFSVYAASLGAKVLAFEPAKVNFDLLQANIALNDSMVDIRKLGIMDTNGDKTIFIRPFNFGGTSFFNTAGPNEVVQTITLKEVFDTENIEKCDFLKLDCEGAELGILSSFPYFDRVKQLAFEYVGNDKFKEKFMDLVRQQGYEVTSESNERMGCIYGIRK